VERKTERRGGLAHATASGLPTGAPEALQRAADRALVREALGEALGARLVELREAADGVVLVFAGEGWERALTPHAADIARRVRSALGRPEIAVRIESRAVPAVRERPGAAPRDDASPPADRRERLAAVQRRLAERAARRGFR